MRDILFSTPDITHKEIDAVSDVMRSGWITTGSKTKEFETKISNFCKTKKSICMNSATACLESVLRILEIGPGDEVIVPAYTYTASCSVICHVGATPVMIDVAEDSFEMDYDQVLRSITSKTKAIIPVDIGGILCNYNKIFEIVNLTKNIFSPVNSLQENIGRICIIADSAHSFGARIDDNISGSLADFTVFSFHAAKNLVTAEGGALTWTVDDDSLYDKFSLLSLHGQNKDALAKMNSSSWEYDIIFPGFKTNMTDICAAMGMVQLERFDSLISKRRELAYLYNSLLENYDVQIYQENNKIPNSTVHLYMIRLNNFCELERNKVIKNLMKEGIFTNVHYKPLPMMTAYKNLGFSIKNFPNSYKMYENEISLPLHTLMTNDDVYRVCDRLKKMI